MWSHTWPGPRLIEVGNHESNAATSEDDADPIFSLRILGNFSVRKSIHTEQEDIPQHWFSPVALFVCPESRQHTLRHYRLIAQPEINHEPFYYDPSIDILWFNYDFTGDAVNHPHSQEHMDQLYQSYGAQLDHFRTVLIDEIFWNPESGNKEYLAKLLGLQTILIMDTSRHDMSRTEVIPIIYDEEDFEHHRAVGKKEYANFMVKHPNWPLKSIEYLARNTNSVGLAILPSNSENSREAQQPTQENS